MLHFCGEIRLNHWYRCAAEWHTEPVIKQDLRAHLPRRGAPRRRLPALHEARDRARRRRGQARVREDRRADGERVAPRKPLHPTNLHVNSGLFPNDTVQSRLPDPSWLERWLDEQIRFDAGWEKRVVAMILKNLSSLFGERSSRCSS